MIIPLVGFTTLVSTLPLPCIARATAFQSAARPPSKMALYSYDGSSSDSISRVLDSEGDDCPKIYFDIAIPSSPPSSGGVTEYVPLGRLTFRLVPTSHPHHLPLHASNLVSLASGIRRSVDPKATYVGCTFRHSPASVEDGSMRYRWGHACDGHGRNGIRTTSSSWDEPFSDPERMRDCSHGCFGGVYYGMAYDEVLGLLSPSRDDPAVLLTVPIQGPGAGTSKFSIVRVSESPREWRERLLHSSAVLGYLDCGADGSFGGKGLRDDNVVDDGTRKVTKGDGFATPMGVLRAMARQRMGPPKIVDCGVTSSSFVD
ncbi:hypothetical protein ACHAW5_010565 [Stephanodiscus triporus]|uniref:Uncharacterized protein n=1 Tax=Stephanodiscus triporus TaxID=2934178 RepID=A0ABD3PLR3_9STRA